MRRPALAAREIVARPKYEDSSDSPSEEWPEIPEIAGNQMRRPRGDGGQKDRRVLRSKRKPGGQGLSGSRARQDVDVPHEPVQTGAVFFILDVANRFCKGVCGGHERRVFDPPELSDPGGLLPGRREEHVRVEEETIHASARRRRVGNSVRVETHLVDFPAGTRVVGGSNGILEKEPCLTFLRVHLDREHFGRADHDAVSPLVEQDERTLFHVEALAQFRRDHDRSALSDSCRLTHSLII